MKFSVLALLFLLLTTCGFRDSTGTVPHGAETDRLSLLDFKRGITLDPHGAMASWNDSAHVCAWRGVSCSRKHPGRVTVLNLTSLDLAGSISPSLGNLTFLEVLDLPANGFAGEIPPSLGRLRRLAELNLNNNSLQGRIPEELTNCSNLQGLYLYGNQLVGRIPPGLGALSGLRYLLFSENNLTGAIPPSLGNVTTLRKFAAAINNLAGSIPDELGQLSRMVFLSLADNALSGKIPPSLFNLSSLNLLSLGSNALDKASLPAGIGDNLPNLQYLVLAANQLEGRIPASLVNASRLVHVDLSNNSLTGQVPSALGRLAELSELNLQINNLAATDRQSWSFMDALTNCTLLRIVSLASNRLEGAIPDSVGNLSAQLQILLLGGNRLSGTIPSGIANLRGLFNLGLDSNNFGGSVEWVGSLENLQLLTLEHNNFTGRIPPSVGNLTQLLYLSLNANEFEGFIPPGIGHLRGLLKLDLSDNNLRGGIPEGIFSFPSMILCNLSHNNLSGPLPAEVGSAVQLSELCISSNKLSGMIPNSLGDCEELEVILMDNNMLEGPIPATLGNLKSLRTLNLSGNGLSGSIPGSLGNLRFLEQLDLSHNHLQGEIPRGGVFKNATAVLLEGNQDLCGGVPELDMPACDVMHSRRGKKRRLLAEVLPVACSMFILASIFVLVFLLRRKRSTQNLSGVPSFGRQFPQVSYRDLVKATEDFAPANLLGKGRYGSVYKGKIAHDETILAVKVFDLEIQGGQSTFIAECEALRNIKHRNLVNVLTACSSIDSRGEDFRALVYEFMPNGNLDMWLHPQGDHGHAPSHLSLTQRMNIAIDIADAVHYLHDNSQRPLVHCDLKPSNILLDDDMVARVGDFGLARFCTDSKTMSNGGSTSSVGLRGTIGYAAPEYAAGGYPSTSGDVYSFGVILLEMFTGKRPTDDMFTDGLGIVNFVERNFPNQIFEVVDADLCQDYETASKARMHDFLSAVLKVGLSCTQQSPKGRMNMREVANKMHAIRKGYDKGGALLSIL